MQFSYRLLKYVSDFVAIGFMNGIVFHSLIPFTLSWALLGDKCGLM
jgi:hypothetical protein